MNVSPAEWRVVECQADLDALEAAVAWEHARTVEFCGLHGTARYFPRDISLSGHVYPHVHILSEVNSPGGRYVHALWISCEWYSSQFVESPHFKGHVDTLKRVEVLDARGATKMRCARLIYRFIRDLEPEEFPFLPSLLAPEIERD